MALTMAGALAKKTDKQKPAKGKGSLANAISHPGSVPLPSSFYKSLDLQSAGELPAKKFMNLVIGFCLPYLLIC